MSDRLTTLPFELFEMIVLLAQSHPRTKPLYVSKAFLPFVRRPIFKVTKIKSYERLETCLELINSNEAIIPFVAILKIKLVYEKDVGSPTNKVLRQGFSRLFATQILAIHHSARLGKIVLSPPDDNSMLPSMHTLLLVGSVDGFQNPLDPFHYRYLSRYYSLSGLSLSFTCNINGIDQSRKEGTLSNRGLVKQRIGHIGLDGCFVQNPSLRDFISNSPIVSLNLVEKTSRLPTSLSPILQHLPSPQEMKYLALACDRDRDPPEDLSDILSNFPSLVSLDLAVGSFNEKVLEILNDSTFPNLTTLILRIGIKISIQQIKSLISGPKKLSNLIELELELIMRDPSISASGDYGWSREYELEIGPLGINDRITAKGLEEIVQLADREGLKVTGYATEFARREIKSRRNGYRGRSNWERYESNRYW